MKGSVTSPFGLPYIRVMSESGSQFALLCFSQVADAQRHTYLVDKGMEISFLVQFPLVETEE